MPADVGVRTDRPAFTVLDEALIKQCIHVAPTGVEEDKKGRDRDHTKSGQNKAVEFFEVQCLIFSFTGISVVCFPLPSLPVPAPPTPSHRSITW